MNPYQKWRCEECGEVHKWEDDARTCCRPSVSEVWSCGECGENHEDESDALLCCAESGEDIANPVQDFIVNQKELEAQGQQRLFSPFDRSYEYKTNA